MGEKENQEYDQTFTIVGINAQVLTVSPRPMAYDDAALTDLEKEYANINTQITSGANVTTVNTTGGKANPFWATDSIQVIGGDAPWELMNEFGESRIAIKMAGEEKTGL